MKFSVHFFRFFATPTGRIFSASEMTYIVSSGALNSTHSLTHSGHTRIRAIRHYTSFWPM